MDSLGLPVLNYLAHDCGYCSFKDIELIHTRFCRKVLYVKNNLYAAYGELGRVPMFMQRTIILIKYWEKTVSCQQNMILYKTYTVLKNDVDRGWAFQIKLILGHTSFSNI